MDMGPWLVTGQIYVAYLDACQYTSFTIRRRGPVAQHTEDTTFYWVYHCYEIFMVTLYHDLEGVSIIISCVVASSRLVWLYTSRNLRPYLLLIWLLDYKIMALKWKCYGYNASCVMKNNHHTGLPFLTLSGISLLYIMKDIDPTRKASCHFIFRKCLHK